MPLRTFRLLNTWALILSCASIVDLALPGVTSRLPQGKGPIGHGLGHQPRIRGATGLAEPGLLFQINVAGMVILLALLTIHSEGQDGWLLVVLRHRHGATGQAWIPLLLGASARKTIPGHVQPLETDHGA